MPEALGWLDKVQGDCRTDASSSLALPNQPPNPTGHRLANICPLPRKIFACFNDIFAHCYEIFDSSFKKIGPVFERNFVTSMEQISVYEYVAVEVWRSSISHQKYIVAIGLRRKLQRIFLHH